MKTGINGVVVVAVLSLSAFTNCKRGVSISFVNKTGVTLDSLCIDGACFCNVKKNDVVSYQYDSVLFDSGIYVGKVFCRAEGQVLKADEALYCGSSLKYLTSGTYQQDIVICNSGNGNCLCFEYSAY